MSGVMKSVVLSLSGIQELFITGKPLASSLTRSPTCRILVGLSIWPIMQFTGHVQVSVGHVQVSVGRVRDTEVTGGNGALAPQLLAAADGESHSSVQEEEANAIDVESGEKRREERRGSAKKLSRYERRSKHNVEFHQNMILETNSERRSWRMMHKTIHCTSF
jgi:hypothetical protein